MRNGQQHHHGKRMRGRGNQHNNNRRNHNPLTRVYESNGPDVKIRGTANHVAEKYLQLARDAQSSGDPIAAENYLQHAEHYFRMIAAAQEQFRQQNPNFQPRPEGGGNEQQFQQPRHDGEFEDGEDEGMQPPFEAPYAAGQPQPYLPQNAQPFAPRDNNQQNYQPREQRNGQAQGHEQQRNQPRPQNQNNDGGHEGLPAFITGGAPQPAQQAHDASGQNGYENGGQPDRFPLHRRRRRHRGPRGDNPGQQGGNPGGDDSGA
ncbi:MAG: DUF4167 domain-containing protein [Alphaproteobacteria bacterium]|nr:DUF4167 domain-containing protein [Alphaproteobacteria bacterium]